MATLLKIDLSPRGEYSISRKISAEFTAAWEKAHPEGEVVVRDLATTHLPYVEMPWIIATHSDPSGHDEEQKASVAIGNELIAELKAADEYVFSTPMYNFGIPARFKGYIDHIVRAGQTFRVNADGTYEGLLTGKKATVIIASAGEYGAGSPAAPYDLETPYLRHILGFIGVTDVTFLRAGSTWKVDRGMATAEEVLAGIEGEVVAAAGR
jgi:FMN-dependent NADH-azoreductase